MMLTILGKEFYKKDSAWKPVFERSLLIVSLIFILSFLLFTIIWVSKRLILKQRGKEHLHISYLPRLFPLLTVLSLVTCVFSLSMWFGDYNNAGKISITSILVFIFSLLFPLFSLIGFWITCFKNKNENRIEKVYLIIVSIILVLSCIIKRNYVYLLNKRQIYETSKINYSGQA